jgi:hypothetical protein
MLKSPALLLVLWLSAFACTNKQSHQNKPGDFFETVKQHEQIYNNSCIPSSVEMVLKYNNRVGADYYDLQNEWKKKLDGTFKNFNGKTIEGIKFTQQFDIPRSDSFPYESLYKTIDRELEAGRKVIISLPSGAGWWHMYVLHSRTSTGDYMAFSRGYNMDKPLIIQNVKQYIQAAKGTDIMTYEVVE